MMLQEKPPGTVTRYLEQWAAGDLDAFKQAFALVYQDLRASAHWRVYREKVGLTLTTDDLVNELFIKWGTGKSFKAENRAVFQKLANRAYSQILIDHANKKKTGKRGSGALRLDVSHAESQKSASKNHADNHLLLVMARDQAIEQLCQKYPERGAVAHLRLIEELTLEEIVACLKDQYQHMSLRTVRRHWQFCKKYLSANMKATRRDMSSAASGNPMSCKN